MVKHERFWEISFSVLILHLHYLHCHFWHLTGGSIVSFSCYNLALCNKSCRNKWMKNTLILIIIIFSLKPLVSHLSISWQDWCARYHKMRSHHSKTLVNQILSYDAPDITWWDNWQIACNEILLNSICSIWPGVQSSVLCHIFEVKTQVWSKVSRCKSGHSVNFAAFTVFGDVTSVAKGLSRK